MNRPLPGYGLNRGELWTHAIGMAAGARLLADRVGPGLGEAAYAAGMLADIGMLALDSLLQEEAIPNMNARTPRRPSIWNSQYLGIDHATLGAAVARRSTTCWSERSRTTTIRLRPARWPNSPPRCTSPTPCWSKNGIGAGHDTSNYPIEPNALVVVKVKPEEFETLFASITPLIQSAKSSLHGEPDYTLRSARGLGSPNPRAVVRPAHPRSEERDLLHSPQATRAGRTRPSRRHCLDLSRRRATTGFLLTEVHDKVDADVGRQSSRLG